MTALSADFRRRPGVAGAVAVRARDVHVREELHVQADAARPVTGGAAEFPGIIGEVPRFPASGLGVLASGEDLPEFVVDIGICSYRRAHVDADGRSVDQLDLADAFII